MVRLAARALDRAVALGTRRRWPHYERLFSAMERWPRDRIDEYRRRRLAALVEHAYRNVPYWRRVIDGLGATPAEVGTPEGLAALPPLTKDVIDREGPALLSRGAGGARATVKSTGGSTGHNVWLRIDMDTHDRRRAAGRLTESWDGVGPGTRVAVLWGSRLETRPSLRARLLDRLSCRRFFSVYGVGEAELSRYLAELQRFRPEVISSYPSILADIARRLGRRACRRLGVRLVYSSAESLDEPTRSELEDAFGAPVRNRYASREFGMIASDCPTGPGLHLMDMRLWAENGRAEHPEAPPELLLTDLDNRSMPLIRYRIEDAAVIEDSACPCGRSLSRLARVEGRVFDVVYTPAGRAFGGSFFPILLRPFDRSIRRFQVVQDRLDHLTIRVVPGHGWDAPCRDRVLRIIAERMGPEMKVDLKVCREIPPAPSGKRRPVVSLLSPEERRRAASGNR
ncbi:MAG: phenylacetate--CoA ligase family protein [Acidobacteria bacterium]|nr:MAG: phenylacetate--CoA ligase family protein [Acidobacteriota bacterium]